VTGKVGRERNLKQTKNASHGRRMGGRAIENATIKINIKAFVRRRMKHISHIQSIQHD
jgi:hypothetical protein